MGRMRTKTRTERNGMPLRTQTRAQTQMQSRARIEPHSVSESQSRILRQETPQWSGSRVLSSSARLTCSSLFSLAYAAIPTLFLILDPLPILRQFGYSILLKADLNRLPVHFLALLSPKLLRHFSRHFCPKASGILKKISSRLWLHVGKLEALMIASPSAHPCYVGAAKQLAAACPHFCSCFQNFPKGS